MVVFRLAALFALISCGGMRAPTDTLDPPPTVTDRAIDASLPRYYSQRPNKRVPSHFVGSIPDAVSDGNPCTYDRLVVCLRECALIAIDAGADASDLNTPIYLQCRALCYWCVP